MKELRDYQNELSLKGASILNNLKILYLMMEVRSGKTATALNICKLNNFKEVAFITKKKAIQSIENDYKDFGFNNYFNLTVINDESLHKLVGNFDAVIHDEHHRFGAFPKPNMSAKLFKKMFGKLPQIYLSGTPFPESYSQVYHQFWTSENTPFKHYTTFYKWSYDFVNVKDKHLGFAVVKDYSEANYNKIKPIIDPYCITFTQKQAGFETSVIEKVLYCDMNPSTNILIKSLIKNKVIEGKEEVILADTGVKLQNKIHQLSSGTVIFESGNSKVLDYSKAEFIKEQFKDKKIAIFYKFKEEYNALKCIFGESLTNNLEDFNNTSKSIALQIVSGREGISLKNAEFLVYYNIDFSAVSYFQSRDRLTTMERKTNYIFWIFSKGGIEEKIYKSVMNKKDYTLNVFKKDFNVKI